MTSDKGAPPRRSVPPMSSLSMTVSAFTMSAPGVQSAPSTLGAIKGMGSAVTLPRRRYHRTKRGAKFLVPMKVDSKWDRPDINLPDMSKLREKLDSFDPSRYIPNAAVGKSGLLGATAIAVLGVIGIDVFRFFRGLRGGSIDRWKALLEGGKGDDGTLGATAAEPTVIYDVRGRVVATLSGESVPLSEVSDNAWQAIVASEDRRFFAHYGVDIRGFTRAVVTLGKQGGGSTITQQLVKNMLLTHDRTITRKAVEMVAAVALETQLSKPRLLEHYLNNVYWGHGVYGISGASAAYFRKKPSELSVSEGALLAGLLPAPEWLSPYRNPQGALRVRAQVLQRMAAAGYIEEEDAIKEMNSPLPAGLSLGPNSNPALSGPSERGAPYRAPYFVSEVLYQLRDLCGDDVMNGRGGLQIYTTVDLGLQERAEQLVKEDGEELMNGEQKGEAAIVAMEPGTGAVRVLVGGRNFANSPYNRAVEARRSPGSSFKPIVYLAALSTGAVTPSTELEDEEVIFKKKGHNKWIEVAKNKTPGQGGPGTEDSLLSAESGEGDDYEYHPHNYSRRYRGPVSLRDALADSLNLPTVKLCNLVGVSKTIEMARKLGIKSELPETLSLSLGACEVTPLEMACVYNTIAAGGVYSRPHLVLRVKDKNGHTVYRHKTSRRPAASGSACADLHRMLRAAVTRGTGRAAASGWPSTAAAGKTGTSDDYRDAWFCGYTPTMSAVVWMGRDDNGSLPGSASTLASPLWARFMRAAQGSGVPAEKGNMKRRNKRWNSF